jgi:predicted permease
MRPEDLKLALRTIRRSPTYASVVVGTLALTLGASTAVFSIVNGVLLRPLPYANPEQLVSIREVIPQWAQEYPTLLVNPRHFDLWRNRATTFGPMAAMDWRTMTLTGAGEPFQATVLRTSGTLFEVLQTQVGKGRALQRRDEQPDQPRVIVISHELWVERFSGDTNVLGRTLALSGTDYTVVGVLPPRFDIPVFDVLNESAALRSNVAAVVPLRLNLENIGWMEGFNHGVIARVKNRTSLESARAELDVLQQSVRAIARLETQDAPELRAEVLPLNEAIVGGVRLRLLLLLGAVIGVVMIACANLANLSLTRALDGSREAALRIALGATRAGLVRTVVTEQLVLAIIGAALGVLAARSALIIFVATAPIDLPRASHVAIDYRVLAFAAVGAVLAGLAIALLPAWRLSAANIQPMLRAGGHGTTERAGVRTRATLLAVQVALSVALLAVTGLFVTSLMRLLAVDPGFSPQGVVAVEISPVVTRYPDTKARAALYDRIADAARQLPGVRVVAWTSALPLTGESSVDVVARPDDARPTSQKPSANYRFVGSDYLRAMSIPILAGRSFDDRDRTRAITPAVMSARAAQTLWANEDPLGKQFTRQDPDTRLEVVGVVPDGHLTALETTSPLMIYVPYWHDAEGKSILVARTAGDAATTIAALRASIRNVDPEMAIGDAKPLRAVVDQAVHGRRYQVALFVAFGVVALAIATLGIYATTGYGVSQRRREMNIRVALGARGSAVFALVVLQSAKPLIIGIAAGCVGALSVGAMIRNLLFEVGAGSASVLGSVVIVVATVGVLASTAAARRGLRINPVAALRNE